jgi:hypothetical protein
MCRRGEKKESKCDGVVVVVVVVVVMVMGGGEN